MSHFKIWPNWCQIRKFDRSKFSPNYFKTFGEKINGQYSPVLEKLAITVLKAKTLVTSNIFFNYIFGIAMKLSFYWCVIWPHMSNFEIWPHWCHISKFDIPEFLPKNFKVKNRTHTSLGCRLTPMFHSKLW